jgi:multiple sugar transport system permease protein
MTVPQAAAASVPRGASKRWRQFRVAVVWLAPVLFVLFLVNVFPLLYALRLSFDRWNLIANVRDFVGLRNYIDLFKSKFFYQVLQTTVTYTGLSVIVQFLLGFGLALAVKKALDRRLKGIEFARVVLMAPLVIAPLMVGFYFRLIYSPQFGILNLILGKLGLPQPLWVHSPQLALLSLVGADTWAWTPFVFTLMLSGLLALPRDVSEAASIDGASGWQTLLYILVPILKPVILVVTLMRTIDSIKYLDLVYVITRGGPGAATEILSFFAYRTGFNEFEMGQSAAIAYVELLIILVLTVLLIRISRGAR